MTINHPYNNSLERRLKTHMAGRILFDIEQKDDLKKYKGKWKLMCLTTTAKSYIGTQVFNTAHQAEQHATTILSRAKRIVFEGGVTVPVHRITTLIPIPIKEE